MTQQHDYAVSLGSITKAIESIVLLGSWRSFTEYISASNILHTHWIFTWKALGQISYIL